MVAIKSRTSEQTPDMVTRGQTSGTPSLGVFGHRRSKSSFWVGQCPFIDLEVKANEFPTEEIDCHGFGFEPDGRTVLKVHSRIDKPARTGKRLARPNACRISSDTVFQYLPEIRGPTILRANQIQGRLDPAVQKAEIQIIDVDSRHLTGVFIESPLSVQQRFRRIIPTLEVSAMKKPN